jgi:hypothetical protein
MVCSVLLLQPQAQKTLSLSLIPLNNFPLNNFFFPGT